ncbi:MFS transporter [Amycolatopsis speibonae]|uniref:MFS transporter n=1 Tax=Amycolatopsis speibonae TaxID=1450224 RepID=A0ABV7P498_9PSEU
MISRAEPGRTSVRPLAVLVAGAFFMEMFDGTAIIPALPAIAESFDVSAVDAGLGVTAYLLTVTSMIPLSGWLADRYGARKVFCVAIAGFVLASVLCVAAHAFWQFVAARVAQGFAGAMMVPVGRTLVLRIAPKADLMAATAIFTWPGLVAPILGPPIGGLVTTYASWRWIFLINAPLGLVALVFALRMVKESPVERRPFDGTGFALGTLSIAALMYGLEITGGGHDRWPLAGGMIVAGLAVAALAVRHSRRHPTPLIDLSPLRIATYAACTWQGGLLRMAINMVPFMLPLLFQVVFGMSAAVSGLLVLTVFAGNLLAKTVTTPIMRYFGFRPVLLVSGLLSAVSLAVCALFDASTPYATIAATCFLGGVFRSLAFTATNTLAFADVPPATMNAASTLYATTTQLSIGLGVAVAATTVRLAADGSSPAAADFRAGFLAGAVIALAGASLFLLLAPSAGAEVSAGRNSSRQRRAAS